MATQPSPSPAPTSGTVAGLTINVPSTSTSSGGAKTPASLYGMGDWGSQTVNPGDLPVTVNVIKTGSTTTGDAVVEAFARGNPAQVATIQHALMMAGYYTNNYTPRYGVVSSQDISAFATAVKTAGQSNHTVSELLESQASAGAKAGLAVAQQQQGQSTAKVAAVTLPNTQDLEAEAIKAFQTVIGRKATPKEAARFAAMYRGMVAGIQRANNQSEYDASNPQLTGALSGVDPTQVVSGATGEQVSPFMGPVGTQGAGGVDQEGRMVAPMMGPVAPGAQRPWVDPHSGQVMTPGFTSQIGGLMSLGQAVQAAQQQPAQPTGLTQINEESAPSAAVAAENYARRADPKGAAANDTAQQFDNFLSIISKSFG